MKDTRIEKGVKKYLLMFKQFSDTDFNPEGEFANRFVGFFKVRRGLAWRKQFFQVFEDVYRGKTQADFSVVLMKLYKQTGRIEASFASKMLHMLNPDLPIWDAIVLSKLKGVIPIKVLARKKDCSIDDLVQNRTEIYNAIKRWYKTIDAERIAEQFDKNYPSLATELSQSKKIDFVLWGTKDSQFKV